MYTNSVAVSNEIPGSFWRPESYMEKVPTSHITGFTKEAELTISEKGRSLANNLKSLSNNYIINKVSNTLNKPSTIDISL